jgi:hypothetical protein
MVGALSPRGSAKATVVVALRPTKAASAIATLFAGRFLQTMTAPRS